MMRIVLSMLGALMMATVAYAGHPLITDDAGTAGKGKGQLEVGISFFNDKDEADELNTSRSYGGDVEIGITVGLLDNLDVILGIPYAWHSLDQNGARIERADGISDITFDAKWRFFENSGWALALKPGISLPSGDEDKGLGAGHTAYRMFLIGTKELESVAFHANVGYIRNENKADERKDIWHASIAAEYEAIKDFRLLANVGMERNPATDSDNPPAFVLGGISYDVSEAITMDAGVKYGLTSTETDWTYLVGITIRF